VEISLVNFNINPEPVCSLALDNDSSLTVFMYTVNELHILHRDPTVCKNMPHRRAMNAFESCFEIDKAGNQHPKTDDLIYTPSPTPEAPLVLTELPSMPARNLSKMMSPNTFPGTDKREIPR